MIRKFKGKGSNSQVQHLEVDGQKITSMKGIADCIGESLSQTSSLNGGTEAFNNYRTTAEKTPIDFGNNTNDDYNLPFSMNELSSALNNSNNSAPGPDDIPYEFLRQLPDPSKECLLAIMNHIWETGDFPSHWQEATVLPFPKPGKDLTNPKNYRPIALTSCICKTLEKMVNARLVWYLESNGYINKEQSGFRKGRSTLDSLSTFETYVRDSFINKEQVVALFFDLEKAYDTTWRYGILKDLQDANLKGQLPKSIQHCLSNRCFKIRVNNICSENYDQEAGIPQGGILSVTLFLLKINGLIKACKSIDKHGNTIEDDMCRILYVDDFTLCMRGRYLHTIERLLQGKVDNIVKWNDRNGFSFSLNKSAVMHLHYRTSVTREPDDYLDEERENRISVVDNIKYLGLVLDRKLCFRDHIQYLRQKCRSALNLLRVVAHPTWGGDQETLLKLYRSLVRSQLDYGLTIYGAAKSSYFQGAKVIQNQGLRICLGAFKSSPVDSLHVEARELPLRLRHEKLLLQYALRISGNTANPAAGHLNQLDEREKYARKTDYIPPFNIRVAKLLQECNLSLESICKLQPPSVPPWKMHKPDIDMSLTVMKKGEAADITYQAAFKEMRDAHRDHHTIFTDGSHMNNRTASAAVHGNHIFSERLPDKASIYTAEVNALYLAQDHVETCDETKHLILSDSKSSLEAMRSRTWILTQPD